MKTFKKLIINEQYSKSDFKMKSTTINNTETSEKMNFRVN